MGTLFGFKITSHVDERLRESLARSDGDLISRAERVRILELDVTLRQEVTIAAYPVGWHLEMPQSRPFALIEDALRFATPVGAARLRFSTRWSTQTDSDSAIGWDSMQLLWDTPTSWRLARPTNGRAPILPATSGLLLGLGLPGDVVQDLDAAADALARDDRSPGGPRRLGRARVRISRGLDTAELPSWEGAGEKERYVLSASLESAFEKVTEEGVLARPLHHGSAALVMAMPLTHGRTQLITVWEGLGPGGEICGVAARAEELPALEEGGEGPWHLADHLAVGAHLIRSPDFGADGDGSPSDKLMWSSVPFRAHEGAGDESYEWLDCLELRQLGEVVFPSRRIVVADPLAPDVGAQVLDLELSHEGPFPVVEVATEADGCRGLLVLIAPGEPNRWIEARAEDGAVAEPLVNTGHISIADSKTLGWLSTIRDRPSDYVWLAGAPASLLAAGDRWQPDVVVLGDIGGDVPISLRIGMDAQDCAVALLVDNVDLPALARTSE